MNVARGLSACVLALCLAACLGPGVSAQTDVAEVYAGSWGPDGAGQGRVFHYVTGTTWDEISPPGGLADGVWDLEWIDGELWAATHYGPESFRDPDTPHGTSGRIWRWDGTTWIDASPPGGFASAVTTVSELPTGVYITVDHIGLLHWDGGNSWTTIGEFLLAAQAQVSSSHDGRPLLYMGQDNTDEFWMHDPDGLLACGTPPPSPVTCPTPTGSVCPAGCFVGSCIHAMTEHDDGFGPLVYAGAWEGRMYRWNVSGRHFEQLPSIPDPSGPVSDFEHVQGLASYDDLLWAGQSDGTIWSSTDPFGGVWIDEHDFGTANPISEMITIPAEDEIWVGFGGVPYRWARRDGEPAVRSFDGVGFTDRSEPGMFGSGVLVLLAVVPEIVCDAGEAQVIECAGLPAEVVLDGTGTQVSAGFTATYEWSGPFVEGTAAGVEATVHFDTPGDHVVTLTVTAGMVTESCETTVSILDSEPPVLAATPACIWPPNHRYRCFAVGDLVAGGASTALDECDGEVAVIIAGASSSQPEDALGDGSTQDDVLFDADTVCVRAERQGEDGAGRDYEIVLVATDSAGNATSATAVIHVPHDQREDRRCPPYAGGVGLLPNAALPLGPDAVEGTYP